MRKLLVTTLLMILSVSTVAADLNSEYRLESWYNGYNQKYFNGELPANTKIVHTLSNPEHMAETEWFQVSGIYVIRFNPKYEPSPRQARATLLHEQCHIERMISGEEDFEDHGIKWQSCMHRLADMGAFDDLW